MNTRIALCVLTYRRPAGLKKLLEAIAELRVPPDVEASLVIVDNDGENPATPSLEVGDWPVTWAVERERGIAHARNRAITEAGPVDAIVFFDDDEYPRVDCLERLVDVWRATGATVVQGGSRPVFAEQPPGWVIRAGYFRRDFEDDCLPIPSYRARTSNVLITRELFSVADPPFNIDLGLSGGEDTFLFRSAELAGYSFVSATTAVVDEVIPVSRVNPRWLIQRQYRIGWSRSYHLRAEGSRPSRRVKRVGAGLVAIARSPHAMWRTRPEPASILTGGGRAIAYGCGLIVGLFGAPISEYDVVHGD